VECNLLRLVPVVDVVGGLGRLLTGRGCLIRVGSFAAGCSLRVVMSTEVC